VCGRKESDVKERERVRRDLLIVTSEALFGVRSNELCEHNSSQHDTCRLGDVNPVGLQLLRDIDAKKIGGTETREQHEQNERTTQTKRENSTRETRKQHERSEKTTRAKRENNTSKTREQHEQNERTAREKQENNTSEARKQHEQNARTTRAKRENNTNKNERTHS
jgi:hypothetical protein